VSVTRTFSAVRPSGERIAFGERRFHEGPCGVDAQSALACRLVAGRARELRRTPEEPSHDRPRDHAIDRRSHAVLRVGGLAGYVLFAGAGPWERLDREPETVSDDGPKPEPEHVSLCRRTRLVLWVCPATKDRSSRGWRPFFPAAGVENFNQPRHFGGLHRLPGLCGNFREVCSVRVWEGWIGLGNRWARRSLRPSGSDMPRVNWRGEIQLGKTKRAVFVRNG
jgi:hypothetical protein